MSNRMIKDSMLVSDKIASLSDFEFRLWIGLILSVDDMGRGDARTAIIKGRVFPLRERVSLRDIEDALHGLAAKGCVSLYTVGGKPYFWFPTWGKHQRIRDVKPKYPGPEEGDSPRPSPLRPCGAPPPEGEVKGTPSEGAQGPVCGSSRQTAAECGSLRPETKTKTKPNQTEPQTEDEDEPRTHAQGVVGVVAERLGTLTPNARTQLGGFVRAMGEECVYKALDAAQDAGSLRWDYVSGILRRKRAQGVHSAEDWDRAEAMFQAAKGGGGITASGGKTIAGTPRDVQPSPRRAQESADWLEEFLAGQTEEGKS